LGEDTYYSRNKEKVKKVHKEYYEKNKEKVLGRNKKYRDSHREQYNKYKQEWRKRHPEAARESVRKDHEKHKDKYQERRRALGLSRKIEALFYYSDGHMKCACCGESMIEFLSIDHVFGGGHRHLKETKAGSIYQWLRRADYPSGFQVLCYNCNCSKGFFGECPHETARRESGN